MVLQKVKKQTDNEFLFIRNSSSFLSILIIIILVSETKIMKIVLVPYAIVDIPVKKNIS